LIKEKKYPNLFIPGAGKSGTSSLHELLNQHPDICMSSVKEPHFWTRPNFKDYTKEDIDNYLKLFGEKENATYRGESSTGYMIFHSFIEHLKQHDDNKHKFIFILRNPIERCYSHYWWLKGIGSEKADFQTAILNDFELEPTHESRLPEANYKNYFQFGLYGKWLEKFYANFENATIKIITSENLKKNPNETINNCFDFLEVERLNEINKIETNKTLILKKPYLYKYAKLIAFNQIQLPQIIKDITPNKIKIFIRNNLMKTVLKYTKSDKTYPDMSEVDRQFIKDLYKEDVSSLKKLTGLNFEEWSDFNN
jgi:Sulfotransferase domain